jgi:hypothetical protein
MGIFIDNAPVSDVRADTSSATDVYVGERIVWPIAETPVDGAAYVCDRFVDALLTPIPLHTPDTDTVGTGWEYAFNDKNNVCIWNGGWEEQGNTCKEVGASAGQFCAKVFGEPSFPTKCIIDTLGIEAGNSKVVVFGHFYGSCIDHSITGIVIAADTASLNYTTVSVDELGIFLERLGGPSINIYIPLHTWLVHDNFSIEVTRYVATGNIDVEVTTYCGDTVVETVTTLNYVVGAFPGDPKYLGFQLRGLNFSRCSYFKATGVV